MAQDGAQNANVYLVAGQVDGATLSPYMKRGQQNHNSSNARFLHGDQHHNARIPGLHTESSHIPERHDAPNTRHLSQCERWPIVDVLGCRPPSPHCSNRFC